MVKDLVKTEKAIGNLEAKINQKRSERHNIMKQAKVYLAFTTVQLVSLISFCKD